MKRITFLLLGALALHTSAFAAESAATAAAPLDTTRFCYYAGQPYSEGATRDKQTCRDTNGGTGVKVFSPNAPKQLGWQ